MKKNSKLRAKIQILFAILFNADIFVLIRAITKRTAMVSNTSLKNICVPGLNCYSCPSALGACPIGSLQFFLNDISMKVQLRQKINLAGLYILGLLTGIGVVVGRLMCGWVCPFGALQELINKITKKNIKLPNVAENSRFVILSLFVFILPLAIYNIAYLSPWFCKLICPAGTLTAGIPLLLIDPDLRELASYISLLKFLILLFLIISLLFTNRTFCKTACPLGTIWGAFNKYSIVNLNFDKASCIACGACIRVCPMNLEVTEEYRSSKCIRCVQCVSACPTGSLTFGLGKTCQQQTMCVTCKNNNKRG